MTTSYLIKNPGGSSSSNLPVYVMMEPKREPSHCQFPTPEHDYFALPPSAGPKRKVPMVRILKPHSPPPFFRQKSNFEYLEDSSFEPSKNGRQPGKMQCQLCEKFLPLGLIESHLKMHQLQRPNLRKIAPKAEPQPRSYRILSGPKKMVILRPTTADVASKIYVSSEEIQVAVKEEVTDTQMEDSWQEAEFIQDDHSEPLKVECSSDEEEVDVEMAEEDVDQAEAVAALIALGQAGQPPLDAQDYKHQQEHDYMKPKSDHSEMYCCEPCRNAFSDLSYCHLLEDPGINRSVLSSLGLHEGSLRRFLCSGCNTYFKHLVTWRHHVQKCEETKSLQYRCPYCQAVQYSREMYLDHKQMRHPNFDPATVRAYELQTRMNRKSTPDLNSRRRPIKGPQFKLRSRAPGPCPRTDLSYHDFGRKLSEMTDDRARKNLGHLMQRMRTGRVYVYLRQQVNRLQDLLEKQPELVNDRRVQLVMATSGHVLSKYWGEHVPIQRIDGLVDAKLMNGKSWHGPDPDMANDLCHEEYRRQLALKTDKRENKIFSDQYARLKRVRSRRCFVNQGYMFAQLVADEPTMMCGDLGKLMLETLNPYFRKFYGSPSVLEWWIKQNRNSTADVFSAEQLWEASICVP